MKITKRQLKRIIKEEKARLLAEQPGDKRNVRAILYDVLIPALTGEGIRGPELITTLRAAADLIQSDMEGMLG